MKKLLTKTFTTLSCLYLSAGVAFAQSQIQSGADQAKPTGSATDLLTNIKNITNTLLIAVGVISVIMVIIGGLRYTLSGGDENGVAAAKNTILYAMVGAVVSILAYAVINFVIGRF